jgi:uncharacterized integral membrane protein
MILVYVITAILTGGLVYGSYLIVRDAEIKFQKRRLAKQQLM